MNNNSDHDHEKAEEEGKYWWILPLLGFIGMTLALMGSVGIGALIP